MAVPRRRRRAHAGHIRCVDANRWGTIGQHGTYILAWTTTPGIVLDVDTRDAIAMPPNVPVMYPRGVLLSSALRQVPST